MKVFIALFLLVLFTTSVNGQVHKFRTLGSWISWKEDSKWTKLEKQPDGMGILIVVDIDSEKVNVYAKQELDLSIINQKTGTNSKGTYLIYTCIDNSNSRCSVRIDNYKEESEVFMTVTWKDMKVVYMIGGE